MRPKRSKAALEERRKRAVRLLKHHGVREVARLVGVTAGSVGRWKQRYAAGGIAALRAKPDRGSKPRLTATQQRRLVARPLQGA